MAKDLVMTFITTKGSKSNMTVKNVKENLTTEQISNVMDLIVGKNIFETKQGDFISKSGAVLVETTKTKYNIEN
ncbi:DUF2922 domain-containing protein [Clostridium sp. Marseille-Q7071]